MKTTKVLRWIERERAKLALTMPLRCEKCGDLFAAGYGEDACDACEREARMLAERREMEVRA